MSKGAVLVAGGAGYIGSPVCKALLAAGYLPVTLDNLSTGHRRAVRYGPLIEGDISSADAVRRVVSEFDIVGVQHLAAKSLVAASVADPLTYYEENVSKGVAFLRHLAANNVGSILFSSTAAVYGDPEGQEALVETAATRPVNPYGATKLAFEEALKHASTASGGRHAILRYFNAAGADPDGEIGEDHHPETHLVPLALAAGLGIGPALNVYGQDYETPDGTAIRDFIHVVDLAKAHLVAFERMLGGETRQVFNAGSGLGQSVLDVIQTVERELARPVPHQMTLRRPGDPPYLVADIRNLLRTGWKPLCSDLSAIVRSARIWHEHGHRQA